MFGLFELIPAISKGLGIIQALVDPDKKEKTLHVAMQKNARKALNVAEDIFDIVDDYVAGNIKEKAFKRKYRALKARFNDLD